MMYSNILNVWGKGQILAYSGIEGKTDFANSLIMRTTINSCGFNICQPDKGGKIYFNSSELADGNFMLSGDFLITKNLKAAFIDTHHCLMEGEFHVSPGENINVISNGKRTLVGAKDFFNPQLIDTNLDNIITGYKKFYEDLKILNQPRDASRRTLAKCISQARTMVYSPDAEIKQRWTTPDRWPHRNMWLWDSVFHAIGMRHFDINLAREAILSVLDMQSDNGFIPHCGYPGFRSEITQPPVLALGVKLLDETESSEEFISRTYPHLKAYIEWDLNNRDTDGYGLLEWFIEADENCRSGESGMDNSPRFDSATQLDATDFNAFISYECEIMADFATRLGYNEDAKIWKERYKQLNKLMNERLWNPEKKFYFDYDVNRNKMSPIMASSGFLPLLCGAASQEQAEMLAAHLENKNTFNTPLTIASIALCNEQFYSKDMWRGPVWANINWLVAQGFRRYGLNDAAARILSSTTNEIEQMYLKYGTLFEFYDDRRETDPPELLRKAVNIPDSFNQVFHDYGWTATLYIDMIMQQS